MQPKRALHVDRRNIGIASGDRHRRILSLAESRPTERMGSIQHHHPAWIRFDDLSLVIRSIALCDSNRLDSRNARRTNKILCPRYYFFGRSGCVIHLFTASPSQYAKGFIQYRQHDSGSRNVPMAHAQKKSAKIDSGFSPLKYSTINSSFAITGMLE